MMADVARSVMPAVFALTLLCGAGLHAQEPPAHPAGDAFAVAPQGTVNPWTHLKPMTSSDEVRFAILADNSGGRRDGIWRRAVQALNLLRPEFVLSVGDFVEGYNTEPSELERKWDEFARDTESLRPPLFLVPGNHDVGSGLMRRVWTGRFGATSYHFRYKQVLFLCMDTSEDPKGKQPVSAAQLERTVATLRANTDVRWTFIFMHKPLWRDSNGMAAMQVLEEAMGDRPYTVFAGHLHQYLKETRNGRDYYTLAVTGGSNRLRGAAYGELDHIVWVTMSESGPHVANIEVGAVHPAELRTPATESVAYAMEPLISLPPLRSSLPTLQPMDVSLRLQNRSQLPVTIKGAFTPHPSMQLLPHAVNETLAAGATAAVELRIRPRRPAPVEDVRPLAFIGTAHFAVEGSEPIQLPIERSWTVGRAFGIPVSAEMPAGNSAADRGLGGFWHSLDVPAQRIDPDAGWSGPADAGGRFALYQDGQSLVFSALVTDDTIVSGDPATGEDAVELWLDARPDAVRSACVGHWKDAGFVRLHVAAPQGEAPEPTLRQPVPDGIAATAQRVEDGYHVRISISLVHLKEMNPGGWDGVRLNVRLIDLDASDSAPSELWWRPDWRSKDNYAGSGTFLRSAPTSRVDSGTRSTLENEE